LNQPYVTSTNIDLKTKEWLDKIAPYNVHKMKINRGKSVLMVIDMQNHFLDENSPAFTCGGPAIIPNVKKLITAFRKAGRPVVFTRHVHSPEKIDCGIMGWWWSGMCIEGSPESEIDRELHPLKNEKVIFKHRYSAFYNTDLETVLRCMKVEDIVITGVMTNMCCESTVRDAYFRDYRVFFPADGNGAMNEEMHLASLMTLSYGFAYVTTVEKIVRQMKK